jgi:hypothetical protein
LLLFRYAIVVRPLVGQEAVDRAIARLPKRIADNFSYRIVHVQTEDDIAATNIRKDPSKAFEKGYITAAQLAFIRQHKLYAS